MNSNEFCIAAENLNVSVYETNRNFKPNGELKNYDVVSLLMNKQENIYKIYELLSYYADSDSLLSGSIKRILVPFAAEGSSHVNWVLEGTDEGAKEFFYELFNKMDIESLIVGIFYDYFLFGNVFLYDRGDFIDILPPYRVAIDDVAVFGQPVLLFKINEFESFNYRNFDTVFVDSLKEKYRAYPEEVLEAINNSFSVAQLNPENTFCIQMPKSYWEKYAITPLVSALVPLSKKNLISEYENSMLNFQMRSFLHCRVGDEKIISKVDKKLLSSVSEVFKQAISGSHVAATAWNVQADWITVSDKNFNIANDLYFSVNKQILEAVGIPSIILSGVGDSAASYEQCRIALSVLEKRIQQARASVAAFFNRLIKKRSRLLHNYKDLPVFKFEKVNFRNNKEVFEEITSLVSSNLISRQTALELLNLNYEQETQRKEASVEA